MHDNCKISTGICNSLTFGSGELDDYGYWEKPCRYHALKFELKHPEFGKCWPFARQYKSFKDDLKRDVSKIKTSISSHHELIKARERVMAYIHLGR